MMVVVINYLIILIAIAATFMVVCLVLSMASFIVEGVLDFYDHLRGR